MSKGQNNVVATRKVEVFRPGTFTAMNGREYTFTDADVLAMASSYDPAGAPAPVVVGHPTHDDPAFGWAQSFAVNDAGVLVAELGDLAPEFVSAVEDGRYRKISMKFFAPDAANNPVPGTSYPRHIGFLGGAAPAVSGLAPVQFAEADDADLIEIEFAEPALEDVASLFRSVREFIIDKFTREDADAAVPEYLIRWVDRAADGFGYQPGDLWERGLVPSQIDSLASKSLFSVDQAGSIADLVASGRPFKSKELKSGQTATAYVDAFLKPFGAVRGRATLFKDKAGGVVPISDELFRTATGEYKVLKRGREVHSAQLGEAIRDPDEIWIGVATVKIPQAQGGGTELVIDRKYIRTDPKTGLIAVFELFKGRWTAKTAFRPQKKNSITTDVNAIDKRRSGVLVYKRP